MNRPKGTRDIYGIRMMARKKVINIIQEISNYYNFLPIETPIFESSKLYTRTVGETSDIVTKEMYDFLDKKNRSMTLRPEGTVGVIRAIIENKLFFGKDIIKYYYLGPMFRYENPQKGRQRQFTQFGVELLGKKNYLLDCEIILFSHRILKTLGIQYQLLINSLGNLETRKQYILELQKYFDNYKDQLLPISLKRLEENPLRILDDKIESKKDFVIKAPQINQFYDDNVKEYFNNIIAFLSENNIEYKIDHSLVRGIDYYTDTTFEFKALSRDKLSHPTIIGGGRYDNLVSELGGPQLSGIGFGIGIERLVDYYLSKEQGNINPYIDVYFINNCLQYKKETLNIITHLRNNNISVGWNPEIKKLNKMLKKSDELNPKWKIILFQKEFEQNILIVKNRNESHNVKIENLVKFIKGKIND